MTPEPLPPLLPLTVAQLLALIRRLPRADQLRLQRQLHDLIFHPDYPEPWEI